MGYKSKLYKIVKRIITDIEDCGNSLEWCPFCGNDPRPQHDCSHCNEDHLGNLCRRDGKHKDSCLYIECKSLYNKLEQKEDDIVLQTLLRIKALLIDIHFSLINKENVAKIPEVDTKISALLYDIEECYKIKAFTKLEEVFLKKDRAYITDIGDKKERKNDVVTS